MKSNDFLGFMSNLVNSLKLGRNTSLDKITLTKNSMGPFTEEGFFHSD